MRRFLALSLLLFFAMFAMACAGGRKGLSHKRVVSEELRTEILESLQKRNDSLRTLRGMAVVRYGSSLFGARGETAFATEAPDRLRIDGLADFGLYHSQTTFNGRTLKIYWPTEDAYFEGRARPETLGRYLLVGLPAETIVEILLGRFPLHDPENLKIFEARDMGQYVLQEEGLEALVERTEEGDFLPLQYAVTDAEGHPAYRVVYDRYEKGDQSLWFAKRIAARFWEVAPSRTKARIEVEFTEIEINPRLDSDLFELKIPKEAKRVLDM